jgi:hypothetical protein
MTSAFGYASQSGNFAFATLYSMVWAWVTDAWSCHVL